ncbi:MAG: pentapeptide repeat-containing protein [Sphaerobacteraceae bacterium]|nr:MAG: pentapeptide repeat-containing protein [Sphaerobacteraceae bacterium]
MGHNILTGDWNRDPKFDQDRRSSTAEHRLDAEIDQLRSEPGYLERLFDRILGYGSDAPRNSHAAPPIYADQQLDRSDFTRKSLIRADFRGASLVGAIFTGANLDRALFCDAALTEANLAEAILTGTVFRGADLSGANLIGADFTGADLRGANLQGAYLWGADFNDADMKDALLDGAYVGGSILSHARNLTLEQFRSTIHDETGAYRLSMLPDPPSKKA